MAVTKGLGQPHDIYVAFAFAAADVLMELSPEGNIKFAVGAAMALLRRPARLLAGVPLVELASGTDRERLAGGLKRMMAGERVRNLVVGLDRPEEGAVAVSVSGYRHPERTESLLIALAHTSFHGAASVEHRVSAGGFLDKEGFEEIANELLSASDGQDPYKMTLLDIPEVAGVRDAMGLEAFDAFTAALGERLKSLSVGGDSVGQLSDTKYGVIHNGAIDAATLQEAVAEAARDAVPNTVVATPAANTLVLDVADMASEDAARALAYAINAFAQEGEGQSMEALQTHLQPKLSQTVSKMKQVRDVIENGNFDMLFQPIVDLWTNVIHHFECLVRFQGADEMSPYDTVTFAEDTGLAGSLDIAILDRVAKTMISGVGAHPSLRFAVNLSGRSLSDPKVVRKLRARLKAYAGLRGRLLFEVTESAEIHDLSAVNLLLQDIRRQGFRVCLDDFGAGSAAFHYLRSLKVDHVKIDGSYIKDCMKNGEQLSFIKAMVGLCNDLGIHTTAEYVEDVQTANMLKLLKVRFGQGWHFGKPYRPRAAPDMQRAWLTPAWEWRKGLLYFKG